MTALAKKITQAVTIYMFIIFKLFKQVEFVEFIQ